MQLVKPLRVRQVIRYNKPKPRRVMTRLNEYNYQRIPIYILAILLGCSVPAVAFASDLYINSSPEGLAGIVYKGYFFRSPAGGEYPKRCAFGKWEGNVLQNCYLTTNRRVTQVSTGVIKLIGNGGKPVYLCKIDPNTHFPWGECSRNGWITSPQQRNP